jgi:hypothetical protein
MTPRSRETQFWLAAAGVLLTAIALLVPAHFSGVDLRVLEVVGERGPSLTALARERVQAGDIGAAQLLLHAAPDDAVPRVELVVRELETARKGDPVAQAWGGPARLLSRNLGNGSAASQAPPVLQPLLRRSARNALRSALGGSAEETVTALLRCVVVTNFAQLPSVATAAGQPVEAATVLAALLVEEKAVTPALAAAWKGAAVSALTRGESMALETTLSDLIQLGLRLDWNQLTALLRGIETPNALHAFAEMMNRHRDRLPVLFAAALIVQPPDNVAGYLRADPEKGAADLALASAHGADAVRHLVALRTPVFHGRFQSNLPFDPVVMPLAAWVAVFPAAMVILKFAALYAGIFLALYGGTTAFSSTETIAPRNALRVFSFTMAAIALAFVALINEPFLLENRQIEQLAFWELPSRAQLQMIIENEISATMEQSALIALGGFFLVQAVLYGFCLMRLAAIRRQPIPDSVKLTLIDNEENLFDAGLYVGLGGTVLSLVFLALGVVKPSLMAAYASTLFGILFVAIFKIFHLRPFRRRLILGAAQEAYVAAQAEV